MELGMIMKDTSEEFPMYWKALPSRTAIHTHTPANQHIIGV